jgi:hypothetical protein
MRGTIGDRKSPIAYGFEGRDLPVYFNQEPVLSAGGGFRRIRPRGGFGGGASDVGQNVTPNSQLLTIAPLEAADLFNRPAAMSPAEAEATMRQQARNFGINLDDARPRVALQFPQNPAEMLLSGRWRADRRWRDRALAVDVAVGKGHIVMFACDRSGGGRRTGRSSWVQRDSQLERSGRGKSRATRAARTWSRGESITRTILWGYGAP